MKLFVDGEEVEFSPCECEISNLSDRMMVRTPAGSSSSVAVRAGDTVLVSYRGRQYKIESRRPRTRATSAASSGELRAPMPGQIVDVLQVSGAKVGKGDKIVVLEAMKTQQAFTAPFDGVVVRIQVEKGDQVGDGDLLAVVEAE